MGSASVIIIVVVVLHLSGVLASTASRCYKYNDNNNSNDDNSNNDNNNNFPAPDKTCAEVRAGLEAMTTTTTTPDGGRAWMPRCLENGDYDLYQCVDVDASGEEEECRCVDCAGKPIRGVDAFSRPPRRIADVDADDESSQCACVRARDEFRRSGMLGMMYRCDVEDGGRYLPYQCRGTSCHCTHPSGKWISTDEEGAQFKIWQAEGKDQFCRELLTSTKTSSSSSSP